MLVELMNILCLEIELLRPKSKRLIKYMLLPGLKEPHHTTARQREVESISSHQLERFLS